MAAVKAESYLHGQITCGSLLQQLQHIWDEVGESNEERDQMLLQIEQECLDVYKKKVDQAVKSRAQLLHSLANARVELTNLLSALGEETYIGTPEKTSGNIKEQLAAIYPALEKLLKQKEERRKEFADVHSQIQKICAEIDGSVEQAESPAVEESDLSVKKLNEFQAQLQDLKKEKSERLHKVIEFVSTVHNLCAVLGMDFLSTITEVHPSLNDATGVQSKSISNDTLSRLAKTVLALKEDKKQRLKKATETGYESDGDHGKRTMWTVADDKLLATAYTITSEGLTVGNGQKGESFWKRVVAYYNANRDNGAKKRTAEKAKTHWASVKKIVNRYNEIYNKWYTDRPSGWSDEDLMMHAHEEHKNTYKTAFQHEHVWRIVKDSSMYAPQSLGHRAAKKARTSESSGAHTDSSNPNTTVDVDDSEARSRPMGQKAAKRKDKEKTTQIEEANETLQQSIAHLEEYNKNKKVEQLIQAHQLLVMDTRGMTDEQFQNHQAICEQIKKTLNM